MGLPFVHRVHGLLEFVVFEIEPSDLFLLNRENPDHVGEDDPHLRDNWFISVSSARSAPFVELGANARLILMSETEVLFRGGNAVVSR